MADIDDPIFSTLTVFNQDGPALDVYDTDS